MQVNFQNVRHLEIPKDADKHKLKEACDAFESEILKFFLKEAMDSKNSLFPKTEGEEIYKSMYQDALSKQLSGSFGYSELLFNYLKNKV